MTRKFEFSLSAPMMAPDGQHFNALAMLPKIMLQAHEWALSRIGPNERDDGEFGLIKACETKDSIDMCFCLEIPD